MRITSRRTATVLYLVDGALGRDFVVSPPRSARQRYQTYDVSGGPTRVVVNGGENGEVTPTPLFIALATDLLAQALYRQLDALVMDPTEQPFDVLWDPTLASDDDGPFYITELSTPQMSTDWVGFLDFTARIIPATQADVNAAGSSIAVQHNGTQVATLSAMRVTVG